MIKGQFMKKLSAVTLFFFIFFLVGSNFSFAGEGVKNEEVKKSDAGVKKLEKNEKDGNVIAVPSSKTKKQKPPSLVVVGGVIVVGVVVVLLLSKKDDTNNGSDESDYDTRVLGIEWVQIPEGEFKRGDNGDSPATPEHNVYLDEYYVSKYEVTFEQYDKFYEETGQSKPSDHGWGRGKRPVINVSWHDAKVFCDWLAKKTGKNIHLLTEAQWEKAYRGTDFREYPWGNSNPNCSILNFNNCQGKTMPVGSYTSDVSPYGVYDLAGNVWEWCQDWYSATYYPISPRNNPQGPSTGSERVNRGGNYTDDAYTSRAAARRGNEPDYTDHKVGFRLCYEK